MGCVFKIDQLRFADADHVAGLQAMLADDDIVDEDAALTLRIEERVDAETQAKLGVMARAVGIVEDDMIIAAAPDIDDRVFQRDRRSCR